jgi:hypothetical protein
MFPSYRPNMIDSPESQLSTIFRRTSLCVSLLLGVDLAFIEQSVPVMGYTYAMLITP